MTPLVLGLQPKRAKHVPEPGGLLAKRLCYTSVLALGIDLWGDAENKGCRSSSGVSTPSDPPMLPERGRLPGEVEKLTVVHLSH